MSMFDPHSEDRGPVDPSELNPPEFDLPPLDPQAFDTPAFDAPEIDPRERDPRELDPRQADGMPIAGEDVDSLPPDPASSAQPPSDPLFTQQRLIWDQQTASLEARIGAAEKQIDAALADLHKRDPIVDQIRHVLSMLREQFYRKPPPPPPPAQQQSQTQGGTP